MEVNCLTLTGRVLEISEPRYSPAGIPHWRLLLEHRSKQQEVGRLRQVSCQMAVQFSGDAFSAVCHQITPGIRLEIQGFLARGSHRSLPSQLVFHAQAVSFLEIENFQDPSIPSMK